MTEFASGYNATLTIPSGQAVSDVLLLTYKGARRKLSISIFAPATLAEAITIEIAPTETGNFCTWQAGNTDIALSADKAMTSMVVVGGALRLAAGASVAADRVFQVQGSPE